MSASIALQLAFILIVGVSAQWIAWRIRLPSILILLATGAIAGPVTGWLQPNALFGDLLMPMVSLSVAVILYEGGLSLRVNELRNISSILIRLLTIGVLVSLVIGTLAAHDVLGFRWPVAALLGAILVVTGPTVVSPVLRHLRLRGKVSSLLKWEGIIVDPIGAVLAVAVFAVVHAVTVHEGLGAAAAALGLTVVVGGVVGVVAAAILVLAIARFLVPDRLQNPVSLSLVLLAFVVSNSLQAESGLLAVTVMGIVVANQKWASTHHIYGFKEVLTVLLISCLFIVMAAQLTPNELLALDWRSLVFILVLVLIARPASVFASTWRTNLTWQEACFLSCMAPRGIVAAAVASVLALDLVASGFAHATEIVPVTFLVVFATVLLYGLLAGPLALRLGLIQANPQGVLFVGANPLAVGFAKAISNLGINVFLIDTDRDNIRDCRAGGLASIHGSALASLTREEIDYAGLGKCLAFTANNEVNSLALLQFAEDFGRQQCYQIALPKKRDERHEQLPDEYRGRYLFQQDLSLDKLYEFAGSDPKFKVTKLTDTFDFASFLREHSDDALPLAVLKPDGVLQICVATTSPEASPGDSIISLCTAASSGVKDS